MRASYPSTCSSSDADREGQGCRVLRTYGLRVILWKSFACCPTCCVECDGSFDGFTSQSDPNSTPPDSAEHVSRTVNNRARAPVTSDRRVMIAGDKKSSARCRLGSNLRHKCPLQLLAVHVTCTVIHDQSQLFEYILSKNGTRSAEHSYCHNDVQKLKRHQEHFVGHGFIAV